MQAPVTRVSALHIPVALAASLSAPAVATELLAPIFARASVAAPQNVSVVENLRQAEVVLSDLSNQEKRLGASEAHTLTIGALAAAHNTANGLRAERIRQAKATFNAALALVVIGVLIIFVGVGLLLFRDTVNAGALTAAIGGVTEVISALLFKLNHETNNRLDEIGKDLSSIEAAQIAMTLIDKIEDPSKRDDAIREAARDLRAQGIAKRA
jgi:drug/metabolite transporter superfamily protein YnfA